MEITKELVQRYLANEVSADEAAVVSKYLNTAEGEKLLQQLTSEIWDQQHLNEEPLGESIRSDKMLHEIKTRTLQNDNKQHYSNSWMRYAASIILLIGLGTAVWFVQNDTSNSNQTVISDLIQKTTTRGQKSTIILSDGSKVILNSESSISYTKYFTDSTRIIELKGEAFFDVAKDKNRPFMVVANGTTTTALGTSFNILTSTSGSKISLATGKVMITGEQLDSQYFLEPGEALSVDYTTHKVEKGSFDSNKDLLWKDGIIYFEDEPMADVILTLEKWYDVQFEIDGEILNKNYTGRFDNTSLENVLKNMAYTLDFEFLMNGKKIKIVTEN